MGDFRELKADFAGLVTAPGLLVRAQGSCIEARNVTFDAPGAVRKRRGFERMDNGTTGGSVQKVFASRLLNDSVMVHRGGTGQSATTLEVGNGSAALTSITMVKYGIGASNLTRTTDERMQMAMSQRNHYVTASEGVARIESNLAAATQRFAGMPRGLPLAGFQVVSGAIGSPLNGGGGTALADGFGRSYRVTWHRKDQEGVVMGGAPTGRTTIRNVTGVPGYVAASAASVNCFILLPKEIGSTSVSVDNSGWFYRLWGTRSFDTTLTQGDDEMFLVNEAFVTSANVIAGYAAYVDDTPDAFLVRQPTLETNAINFPASEVGVAQGVLNESAPPPVANVIAYWQDVMWYGDCEWFPRVELTMVALPANGDTLAITYPDGTTTTFTFSILPATSADPALYTGFGTTALNIEATCQALVECINRDDWTNAKGVQAYYVSVGDQLPGRIVIQSTVSQYASVTSPAIVLNQSVATDWRGDTQSTTDEQANALAFSKPFRADAVPPANLLAVGSADTKILQLMPYRDRMLVFTDAGIYQVVGRTFADFSVLPFDLGYRLLSRETVVLCEDRVFAWCYEGIIEVTDGGVQVVSTPIEPTVTSAILDVDSPPTGLDDGYGMVQDLAFAVAQRSEHKVHFWFAEAESVVDELGGCCSWLTFDTRTRAWSTNGFDYRLLDGYLDNRSHGVCRYSDDRMVMGNYSSGSDTFLFLERRSYTSTDYTDEAQDGNSQAVTASVTWQFAMPVADGACHWQQTTIHWDAGEVSWRPLPSQVVVSWETEHSSATLAVSSPTEEISRVEVGLAARRGNRCRVSLNDATTAYMGVVGVTQSARVGSRFARRGT